MIVPVIKIAAGAVAGTLTFSCVRNILQTVDITSEQRIEDSVALGLCVQDRLSEIALSTETPSSSSGYIQRGESSSFLLLNEMTSLSRKECLCLFLSCPSICMRDVEGEWNGVLLENNGWVLTQVTRFITNQLFGRGSKWNGKTFQVHGGGSSSNTRLGVNRFSLPGKGEDLEKEEEQRQQSTTVKLEHNFDFSQAPSRLLQSEGPDGSALTGLSCVSLDYSRHHPKFSLWHSMKDEIRRVPLPASCPTEVLIGLGRMAWSGGFRNASPFCLWRRRTNDPKSNPTT